MLLSILTAIFSRWTCICQYQNVSILEFIGVMGDGPGTNPYGVNFAFKQVFVAALANT